MKWNRALCAQASTRCYGRRGLAMVEQPTKPEPTGESISKEDLEAAVYYARERGLPLQDPYYFLLVEVIEKAVHSSLGWIMQQEDADGRSTD
jgi:hypothetical protein